MKRFLMVTPQQPDGMLHSQKYEVQGNELLEYGETHFPVIPLINGYVEDGEEIELITVTYDYKHCYTNFKTLEQEVEALKESRGIRCSITSIEVPFDDSVGAMLDIFQLLIDRIYDDDVLYACITYGSKPIPLVLVMAMQYAYRLRRNVSVECVVYGQVDRSTTPGVFRIYDVTALVKLDELVRVLADFKVANPEPIIKQILAM